MFRIRFKTLVYRPDLQITIRSNAGDWADDIPGLYENDEWRFDLPEDRFAGGMHFKFVLEKQYWMTGPNLFLHPNDGDDFTFEAPQVQFPPINEVIVENASFQQMFFGPNLAEGHVFDVVVIGSGVGGGIVAEQLADLGADVLVLEAGSYLFPTHIANLPRQHQIGQFDKHVWGLYDEFKVENFVNAAESQFGGGQAFNLGGRSVFWGGLIPRMQWWELEDWPSAIRWHLESPGYERAEQLMKWPLPPSSYQQQIKTLLASWVADFDHLDASIAVRHSNPASGTIGAGMFSTADLLAEAKLTDHPVGAHNLSVNLNHAAVKIHTDGDRVSMVEAHDLLSDRIRTFQGRYMILAAGTVESAKLAKISDLKDPTHQVGKGLTDHPILFTHFSIPASSPYHRADVSSKTLSRHRQATPDAHPYNLLLELGADLNQGRYLDPETLARHRAEKGNAMLCEIVFLFNAPLMEANHLEHSGPSYAKPVLHVQPSAAADAFGGEVEAIKNSLIAHLGGEPLPGQDLSLKQGAIGGVAHEVGTLRLGSGATGVVDTDLKYNGYDNLFVCDLSVFPTSPAANPTLTLAALSLRLADHVKSLL